MNMRYDLHSHSYLSDGTLAPAELVAAAAAAGVGVLALTDHDVTDGLEEAQAAAVVHGLHLVPGVEISATWNGLTVHVVGLGIDPSCGALQQGLAGLRAERNTRAAEIGRRLARHRLPGIYEGAAALARGAIVSRTHFARYMVSQGLALNMGQAFRHYLSRGAPGHVPSRWAEVPEVVRWIRAAGGRAVLAHPARYRLSGGKLRKLLGEFSECGGAGIEVVCGSHNADNVRHFAALAQEFRLLASLGSDYHGPDAGAGTWGGLGRLAPLPEGLVPVWEAWEPKASSSKLQA
jgi:predicted metal-dependent phosphoesterase TrpH